MIEIGAIAMGGAGECYEALDPLQKAFVRWLVESAVTHFDGRTTQTTLHEVWTREVAAVIKDA